MTTENKMLQIARERYTTKHYSGKQIPREQFEELLEILRLAPSSVNAQSWKFITVSTAEAKNKIMEGLLDFNRERVSKASDIIVFAVPEKISEELKKQFRPEFLNRVDDVIVFRRLERADLERIVLLETERLIRRMRDQGKELILDPEVISFLIDQGYQPEYGARPLRRAVERYLEDALAEDILRGFFKDAPVVHVKADNRKLVFFPEEKEEEPAPAENSGPKRKSRKKKDA